MIYTREKEQVFPVWIIELFSLLEEKEPGEVKQKDLAKLSHECRKGNKREYCFIRR